MPASSRYRFAARAAAIHGLFTVLVASMAAWLVFAVWYAYPYREMSGGRELFLLVIAVDVVCGPLLTFVLFNPKKPRRELWTDLGLVALIQIAALAYGMWTVWQARPLYLVHEIDRFRVIAAPDVLAGELREVRPELRPRIWAGPLTVSVREPRTVEEHNTVLFEAATGGRDYGARPDFYIPYDDAAARRALTRARPLAAFLQKQPDRREEAEQLARRRGADLGQWLFVPVISREDWIAVLNQRGEVEGFLRGDGFF